MRSSPRYEDFVVRIEKRSSGYLTRLVRSPYGSAEEKFIPPYDQQDLTDFLDDMESILLDSGAEPRQPQDPRELGALLFKSLFSGTVGDRLSQSLAHVNASENTGLRIQIEIDPSNPALAPLAALPWELLRHPEKSSFLSQNILTPVVRYIDVTSLHIVPPVPIDELRILACASSPKGTGFIHDDEDLERVRRAWGQISSTNFISLPRPCTLLKLRQALREHSPHVFHFIGHGSFDSRESCGSLYFETDFFDPHEVDGELLAANLTTEQKLRLVFLSSCEGAKIPHQYGQDPYRGVASALLKSGVTSVVAMQFPVSTAAAIEFTDAFYRALADGDPIEAAVAEARLAMQREEPYSWEWITPTLYMSSCCGSLFDKQAIREPGNLAGGSQSIEAVHALFDLKEYCAADDMLNTLVMAGDQQAEIFHLRALARLAGQRPRSLSLRQIKYIEKNLSSATTLDQSHAHFYFLWALVRSDFYRWNGFRIPSPSPMDLLDQAEQAQMNVTELDRIVENVPISQGPVYEAIQHHRRR